MVKYCVYVRMYMTVFIRAIRPSVQRALQIRSLVQQGKNLHKHTHLNTYIPTYVHSYIYNHISERNEN